MTYGIELSRDFGGFLDALNRVPEEAGRALLAAVEEAGDYLERETKERMPTASGLSRASIYHAAVRAPDGALGIVSSAFPHIVYVELGSAPHFVPIQPLQDWARQKFGVDEKQARRIAHAVSRTIARRGTKAVAMFKDALAAGGPTLDRIFAQARDRVAQRMAGR